MVLGYDTQSWQNFRVKVPVTIILPKKNSNILIAGKSGSGKSLSARYYLYQILHNRESYVCMADYKAGEEYEALEGSPSYASGENAFQMLDTFYQFFNEVRKKRIRLKKHYTLFIEEWSGLLTYAENQSKKQKTDIMAKIGEILAVGRGLNIGIILCMQRADASYFSAGTRDQFQVVISFGRCSAEQFRMLGFHGELEENPTANYKSGQALVLVDGQEAIREITVPWILNEKELCQQIRYLLDRQPDLTALYRAAAEGRSTVK